MTKSLWLLEVKTSGQVYSKGFKSFTVLQTSNRHYCMNGKSIKTFLVNYERAT